MTQKKIILDTLAILELMIEAAETSAQIIRNNFRQTTAYQDKSSHLDIVTQTDLDSQKNIHESLTKGMIKLGYTKEEVGFIEEESAQDSLSAYNFIIDPIDGTTNFSSGIPFSCISIGFAVGTTMRIGVVLEPFSDTLYWSEVGNGAFVLNNLLGKRALALQVKPVKTWLLATHFNGLNVVDAQFELYHKLYPNVRGIRNIGSLTLDLCMQADNVFDAVFCNGCFLWDIAAASVILGEAGGKLFSIDGSALQFDWTDSRRKYELVACHQKTFKTLKKLL